MSVLLIICRSLEINARMDDLWSAVLQDPDGHHPRGIGRRHTTSAKSIALCHTSTLRPTRASLPFCATACSVAVPVGALRIGRSARALPPTVTSNTAT
jgi:hypothetical protein